MRYFKRISKNNNPYIIGKIYPENFKPKHLISVKASVKDNPKLWEEVTETINYEIY